MIFRLLGGGGSDATTAAPVVNKAGNVILNFVEASRNLIILWLESFWFQLHFSECTKASSVTVAAFNGDLEKLKTLIEKDNICVDSEGGLGRYVWIIKLLLIIFRS